MYIRAREFFSPLLLKHSRKKLRWKKQWNKRKRLEAGIDKISRQHFPRLHTNHHSLLYPSSAFKDLADMILIFEIIISMFVTQENPWIHSHVILTSLWSHFSLIEAWFKISSQVSWPQKTWHFWQIPKVLIKETARLYAR